MAPSDGGQFGLVAVNLSALGPLDQRRGRREPLAIALGELAGAGYEAGQTPVVSVDVLQDAAGPARETDAHDRTDVGIGDGFDHALLQAPDRLDRLDEQHPLLEVLQR